MDEKKESLLSFFGHLTRQQVRAIKAHGQKTAVIQARKSLHHGSVNNDWLFNYLYRFLLSITRTALPSLLWIVCGGTTFTST